MEIQGLTDIIKFDHQGFRTDFVLDIIELSGTGVKKVGQWNSTRGVNFTRSYGDHQKEIVENLRNKTLVVSTILVNVHIRVCVVCISYSFCIHFIAECTILHETRVSR